MFSCRKGVTGGINSGKSPAVLAACVRKGLSVFFFVFFLFFLVSSVFDLFIPFHLFYVFFFPLSGGSRLVP